MRSWLRSPETPGGLQVSLVIVCRRSLGVAPGPRSREPQGSFLQLRIAVVTLRRVRLRSNHGKDISAFWVVDQGEPGAQVCGAECRPSLGRLSSMRNGCKLQVRTRCPRSAGATVLGVFPTGPGCQPAAEHASGDHEGVPEKNVPEGWLRTRGGTREQEEDSPKHQRGNGGPPAVAQRENSCAARDLEGCT